MPAALCVRACVRACVCACVCLQVPAYGVNRGVRTWFSGGPASLGRLDGIIEPLLEPLAEIAHLVPIQLLCLGICTAHGATRSR